MSILAVLIVLMFFGLVVTAALGVRYVKNGEVPEVYLDVSYYLGQACQYGGLVLAVLILSC